MIVCTAALLSERVGQLNTFRSVLPVGLFIGIPFLLVLKQPDLGTSLVFLAIGLGMVFVSRIKLSLLRNIAAVGVMFVCSGISVLCQVIYYKKTKKRLFRMAPLHHHLQKLGYSESKIACAYSLVTALAGLLCLAFV